MLEEQHEAKSERNWPVIVGFAVVAVYIVVSLYMIINERGYQACSRIISTTDQILQEALNLKR